MSDESKESNLVLYASAPVFVTIDRSFGYTGDDGAYRVSDQGEVLSNKWGIGWHPLLPALDRHGYQFVTLCFAGESKLFYVHKLVCQAFHGPKPSPELEVCHRPRTKRTDCRAESLYWGTHQENMAGKVLDGTDCRGEKHYNAKLNWTSVREIRAIGLKVPTRILANRYNVSPGCIRNVLVGATWKE